MVTRGVAVLGCLVLGCGSDEAPPDPGGGDGADICTEVRMELLTDPGVDQGRGWSWQEASPWDLPLILNEAEANVSPDTQPYLVWLGGYDSYAGQKQSDTVWQDDIQVPEGAGALHVTGHARQVPHDVVDFVSDVAAVDLRRRDPATGEYELVENLIAFDNTTLPTRWTEFEAIAAEPHAGETLSLVLYATLDDLYTTSFLFDSLSLSYGDCQ